MSQELKYTGVAASIALCGFAITAVALDARKTQHKAELDALARVANPIALRCALDGVDARNQTVCLEALRVPAAPAPVRQAAM